MWVVFVVVWGQVGVHLHAFRNEYFGIFENALIELDEMIHITFMSVQ